MGSLRFFLALSVIFAHAGGVWSGFGLGNGRLAVQTFYMISGFYMSLVWSEKYSAQPNPIRTFYISRALRIYPLYFIVLAISTFMALYLWKTTPQFPLLNPVENPLDLASLLWVYLTQITLVGMETPIFYGLHNYWISPVAWSLGLELTFYALVPFLVTRIRLMVWIFIFSIVGRYGAYLLQGWQTDPAYQLIWAYRFFPFEIALFLAGVFAHRTLTRLSPKFLSLIALPEIFLSMMFAMIGALCYFSIFYPRLNEATYWCYYAMTFAGIIVLFHNTKNSKHDSHIGDLSYPMYILHLPVIWFLIYVVGAAESDNVIYFTVPITILISIVFSKLQILVDRYRHSLVKAITPQPR